MENTNKKFENLFEVTNEHLKEKKYLYKPVSKKNGKKETYPNGDYKYNSPTPHKITLLTQAFNIALENYKNVRHPFTGGHKLKSTNISTDILLRFYNNKHYKTIESEENKENVKLIDDKQNYSYKIFEDFREIEHKIFKMLNSLRNYHSHYIHEPGVLSFEDYFESKKIPKKLTTEEYEEAKLWFKKRFDDVKVHLVSSLTNRYKLLQTKLDNEKNETAQDELTKKLKAINYAKRYLNDKLNFYKEDDKTISLNTQLFIALMFLTKRQASIILDKWRDVKKVQGYELTKQTFYTYYCIKESYSINNYNDNLMKFRDITSKLSNMPSSDNENLRAINNKIDELNKAVYDELDKKADVSNIKGKITQNEKKLLLNPNNRNAQNSLRTDKRKLKGITDLNKKIIPLRKRNIFTSVLLQYMVDNNLFKDKFRLAVNKTQIERLDYVLNAKELDVNKNLTDLKDRIKELKEQKDKQDEREVLKKHFKELKRNFTFKTTDEIKKIIGTPDNIETLLELKNKEEYELRKEKEDGKEYAVRKEDGKEYIVRKELRYSIKKKNALAQYKHPDIERPINIVLSSQLLLKWVFVHLITGKNIVNEIMTQIDTQVQLLTSENIKNTIENYDGKTLNTKVFPKSFIKIGEGKLDTSNDKVEKHIANKIAELKEFAENNKLQKKPWKYASNKKIKTIFSYLQFKLLCYVYIEDHKVEIDKFPDVEAFIRHHSFNIHTYNVAREFFRFFGRYKRSEVSEDVTPLNLARVEKLRKEYKLMFSFINIIDAISLEDLFNKTISKFIEELEEIDPRTIDIKKVFKIKKDYNEENKKKIEKNIHDLIKNNHFIKSISLNPDIIDLKQIMQNKYNEFKKEKETTDKPFRFSEYSFIRDLLTKTDFDTENNKPLIRTNVDYIFQHIVPKMGWKRVPSPTMRQLLKIKTEELILWNIAKHYWKEANKKENAPNNNNYELFKLNDIEGSSSFQNFTSFNEAYKRDLIHIISIKPKFWRKEVNQVKYQDFYNTYKDVIERETITIKLKIPAKKYDNKFLSYESSLITEFCLFNYEKLGGLTGRFKIALPNKFIYNEGLHNARKYNLQDYEDLLKVINAELKKSLGFISTLLITEKRLLETDAQAYKDRLSDKYKTTDLIKGYFLSFSDELITKLFEENILNKITDESIKQYMTKFRNNALHYQLQDPKRMAIIKEALDKYLGKLNNTAKPLEYTHEEN